MKSCLVLVTTIALTVPAIAHAQDSPKQVVSLPTLEALRHDPKTQGVLLFVANDYETTITVYPDAPKRTPAQFAAGSKRRVVTSGNLSAVVPLTMAVLTKNPPPPDPYSDMAFDERFLLLLGKLSRAQWEQAAGETGIGIGDLTPEQREIYTGLWSEGALVSTLRVVPPHPGEQDERGARLVSDEPMGAGDIRFRFSRRVAFVFEEVTKKQRYLSGAISYKETAEPDAEGFVSRQDFDIAANRGSADGSDGTEVKAFGVPVMRHVPNILKPGDLSFDAPALGAPVVLNGQKTVGELLAAASKATRLELRADPRIATLPVLLKTKAGGQAVAAGDLLKLLCRSVTGTFRRLPGANADPGLYLLTDDREGLGTRLARLEAWARDAGEKRRKILTDATDACAENEPLDILTFLPGDKYALPAELTKAGDDVRRTKGAWSEGIKIAPDKLSPELREKMAEGIKKWKEWSESANFRTDQVEVKTEFHCDWIVPGKRAFPARFNEQMGWDVLDRIAVPKA
ncbi:MAG: hypothetical protein H7Y38_12515, partial [Armatimonadetes bacterium]|nr:hypothetical protein [Armatimonadota bacterium]